MKKLLRYQIFCQKRIDRNRTKIDQHGYKNTGFTYHFIKKHLL